MKEWIDIIREIENYLNSDIEFSLATIVKVEGSAYRSTGARMLILENGHWIGGISGGCLEGDLLKKAQKCIIEKRIELITYDTREDDPYQIGVGLGCNGKIDIVLNSDRNSIINFKDELKTLLNSTYGGIIQHEWDLKGNTYQFQKNLYSKPNKSKNHADILEQEVHFEEVIQPIRQLWVFGVSFDSPDVVKMALNLGWHVNWVGNQSKMLDNLKQACFKTFNWEDSYLPQKDHLIILMTHDIERDIYLLNRLNSQIPFKYFGILGPRKRWEKLMDLVENETKINFNNQHVHSPIGLKIGAEGPYQISISIFSEILGLINQ